MILPFQDRFSFQQIRSRNETTLRQGVSEITANPRLTDAFPGFIFRPMNLIALQVVVGLVVVVGDDAAGSCRA